MDKFKTNIYPNYQFLNFICLDNDEKQMILSWRNDERIRKWMYNTNIITIENHLSFIANLKDNQAKKYWLVQRNNRKIGVMSIVNIENKVGEWGYYMAPEWHEANLSVEFYNYSLMYLFEVEEMNKLYGYERIGNKNANSLNNLFFFEKKLSTKNMDGTELSFLYRELTRDTWNMKVKNNDRIKKFLDFTSNE
jgi:UDP-4-amino-4,6-dideoxy-N-acetyl-beta-L-altrosamine N-acetyltransferase